jgi:hypothetical protein
LDQEFQETVDRFQDLEKNLKAFHDHVEAYVASVRNTCSLQSNVSGDLLYFFDAKSNNRK